MSAITGIFYRDGRSVSPELIEKMNNRLSHRGPDGSAVWCEGPVALGHQMLLTTPESLHEKLPFEDGESGVVITADARIDNRNELSKELDIEDKEEVSDSYFILKAYLRWGKDCPDKLLGDFAFAIWDKNEEILFCARDYMGVKPFYYYLSDNAFFFATEIKALLCVPEIPNNLNKWKVADHLSGLFEDREITFYEGIIRLPAANSFVIDFKNRKLWKYWGLDPNKEIKMDSDEDYANAFLDIFSEAVKCRLRSAFPAGSLLSGGLDSSSIVCVSRKILAETGNDSLKTFSATFENIPECDEQYYIKKVLDTGNLEPYYVKADKISPLSQIDDILWYLDEPLASPNLYIHWNIYQKARNNDIRVILDGYDGDGTISHGAKFLVDYIHSGQLIKGIRELKYLSDLKKISMLDIIFTSLIFPFIPKITINLFKLLQIDYMGITSTYELINQKLLFEANVKKRYERMFLKPFIHARSSKLYHYFILNLGSYQNTLETADKSAAANYLEPRYPFFDRRILEFCLALPVEQKINKGFDRIIMRRAMEGILPPEVQWRYIHTSLGLNFRKNLITYEKSFLDNLIFHQSQLFEDYINLAFMKNIYNKFKAQINVNDFKMWLVIIFILWMLKYYNDEK